MTAMRPLFLSLFATAVALSHALAADAPPSILGFRAADVAAERAREAMAIATLRPDSLRKNLRILTEEPHVAGTPADLKTAEFVRDRLAAWGWDARIEAIPVYLNYPREPRLELVEPTREPLATRERGVVWDKDAYAASAFDAFHGYSASGDVTAQIVYANYGDVDDLKKLAELGIDVKGKLVLVRYGKIFRGLKVRNAEKVGAAGVIIYSDPADDGFARGDAYPRGQMRPSDAIQRGSVQFLSESPGDPTTPGWPSTANGKRLSAADAKGIPRIPSLPLAWAEAQKIMELLEGPVAPTGWQGALPMTYHVGPGPAAVHLVSSQDYAVRPIWNVIATLKGSVAPDEWVVCGNHRDAWTYGAIDPNSGTICMLEMARAIGSLAKSGWKPRRTLMLCSWDGEEYGLLGSTEWAEANAAVLGAKAVAYVNVDVAVSGKDFRVVAQIERKTRLEIFGRGEFRRLEDLRGARLGVDAPDSDRLAHVAWLATRALPYAFSVAGRDMPAAALRVELVLPSGAMWTYGPEGAADCVAGPAGDYCRVFVQRRSRADTSLEIQGDAAEAAMSVARAYL
jgi:N-acetylated-alpha-linked acidic dipeptidase